MRILLFCLLFILCNTLSGQIIIEGRVTTANGKEPITGASIQVEATDLGSVSDGNGYFQINKLQEQDRYQLKINFLGYVTEKITLNRKNKENLLSVSVRLKEDSKQIKEVTVVSKTKTTEIKEGAQNVEAIDVKSLMYRSVNTLQLLNNTSGLRVQQRGGLGSDANISINGISGKQIKLFVDGIPLDNTGYFTDYFNLPIGQIDRLEIYKGVIPVSLGADALGGAINLITKDFAQNYIEVSHEYASFNTHKASLFTKFHLPKSPISVSLNAYYNESENNYWVLGEVRNKDLTTYTGNFRRFHDAFSSRMIQAQISVNKRQWADVLSLSVKANGANKELQQNPYFLRLVEVYQHANYREHGKKIELRYEHNRLLKGKLSLKNYSAYVKLNAQFIDTGRSDFDWTGEAYQRPSSGAEVSGTPHTLLFNTYNLINRTLLNYKVNKHLALEYNMVLTNLEQKGEDTTAVKRGNRRIEDVYKIPQFVKKLVSGFAINSNFWDDRIKNELGVKYYEIEYKTAEAPSLLSSVVNQNRVNASYRGAFNAFKIELIKDRLALKTSMEHATRLPDQQEVFGDRVFILPNPKLKPETSNNLNAGFQLKLNGKLGDVILNSNYFYRYTRDNIVLIPATVAQFQNVATVKSQGIEADLSYSPIPLVRISGNITYQDIRNFSDTSIANSFIPKKYYKERLPNRPVLFSTAEINLYYPNLFQQNDKLQLYYCANYTDRFFRTFPGGLLSSKDQIPTQLLQNIGLAYSIAANKATLSTEVHNFENKAAFDYFNIQRPGISYHLKLTLNLHSKIN